MGRNASIVHSRGGIFHSDSDRFKTENSGFMAASSLGMMSGVKLFWSSVEVRLFT